MREIKFRAWDKVLFDTAKRSRIFEVYGLNISTNYISAYKETGDEIVHDLRDCILMQFTGLKDKNGLTELYEGDIIGLDGVKKGNQYENADLLKDQSNFLIQGFGTKDWEATNKEAMGRGCQYSE